MEKFTLLALVENRTAAEVGWAIVVLPVRTTAADNGKGFACGREVADELGAGFFFAKPRRPWERGPDEHANGLVRHYFPKSADFGKVSVREAERVWNLPDDRPRRVLGCRTSREALQEALAASAAPGWPGRPASPRARTPSSRPASRGAAKERRIPRPDGGRLGEVGSGRSSVKTGEQGACAPFGVGC